jgi:hypothetical protein
LRSHTTTPLDALPPTALAGYEQLPLDWRVPAIAVTKESPPAVGAAANVSW